MRQLWPPSTWAASYWPTTEQEQCLWAIKRCSRKTDTGKYPTAGTIRSFCHWELHLFYSLLFFQLRNFKASGQWHPEEMEHWGRRPRETLNPTPGEHLIPTSLLPVLRIQGKIWLNSRDRAKWQLEAPTSLGIFKYLFVFTQISFARHHMCQHLALETWSQTLEVVRWVIRSAVSGSKLPRFEAWSATFQL